MGRKMVLFACAVSLLTTYSLTHAAEEPIKLKFASLFTPVHRNAIVLGKFAEEISKRTNGKVVMSYHPGGTLVNGPKMAGSVLSGVVDIGVSHCAFTRGRFPVMETMELPLGRPSPWVATHVAMDFYDKFKPKEWETYHPLMFAAAGPNVVQTLSKPVRTLADVKGLKLRSVGTVADVVKALGGIPIPLEMTDLYDALKRGAIDGSLLSLEVLKGWNMGELIKYTTASWQVAPSTCWYMVMNKRKWDSLPGDAKRVFAEVSKEYHEKLAESWNQIEIEGRDDLKQHGGQIIAVPNTEAGKWLKAVEPVIADFKKELVSKGYKAGDVDAWIAFIKERMEYWKGQEKAKSIPTAYEY